MQRSGEEMSGGGYVVTDSNEAAAEGVVVLGEGSMLETDDRRDKLQSVSDDFEEEEDEEAMMLASEFNDTATPLTGPRSMLCVLYLAVALLLQFIGVNTAILTVTKVFPSTGFIVIVVLNFVFAASSLFASVLIDRLGPKWSIFVGCAGFSVFCLLLLIAAITGASYLIIIGAALGGASNAVIWISTGIYVTRAGSARAHNAFFLVFMLCWAIGGVVGGIVLSFLSINIYLGVLLGFSVAGTVMMIFAVELPPLASEVKHRVRDAFAPLALFLEPKLLLSLLMILTRTTALSYMQTVFPLLVPSLSMQPFFLVSTAICLMLVEVLLILFWERLPFWVWGLFQTTVVVTAMSLTLAFTVIPVDSRVYVDYVIAGCFGFCEGLGMAIISAFGSTLFPKDPSSYFALTRVIEGVSVASIALLATYTSYIIPVSIILCIAVGSSICLIILRFSMDRLTGGAPKVVVKSAKPTLKELPSGVKITLFKFRK